MKALTETGVTDPVEQFRILTVASIIEFEGNEANYAKISGAIENRINNPNGETGGAWNPMQPSPTGWG